MSDPFKRQGWEARLITLLLGKRMLVFAFVILMQLLLIVGLGTLLWFTRVQDTFLGTVVVDGAYEVVAEQGPWAEADALRLGQSVTAEQGSNRAAGVFWGQAFELPLALKTGSLPYLATLERDSLQVTAYVDDRDISKLEVGGAIRIAFAGIDGAELVGSVMRLDGAQAHIQITDIVADEQGLIWQQVGWLVTSQSSYPATLRVRTRRLLSLLLTQGR